MKNKFNLKKISLWCCIAGLLLGTLGFLLGAKYNIRMDLNGIHITDTSPHTETNTQLGNLKGIKIAVFDANIKFVSGDDYGIDLLYYGEDYPIRYQNDGGVLSIEQSSPGFSLFNLNLSFLTGQNSITVTVPHGQALDFLEIRNGMGSCALENVKALRTELNLSMGELTLLNCSLGEAKFDLNNGNATANKLEAVTIDYQNDLGQTYFSGVSAKSLKARMENGYFELKGCILDSLEAESSLGNVFVTDAKTNAAQLSLSNGSVTLEGELRGVTKLNSNLGSVTCRTSLPAQEYEVELSTDLGSLTANGQNVGSPYRTNTGSNHQVFASSNFGDVNFHTGE